MRLFINSLSSAVNSKIYDPILKIDAWGDSLTYDNWRDILGAMRGIQVTRNAWGGETSTQIKERYLLGANPVNFHTIWVGTNNYSSTQVILDDVAEMVAHKGDGQFMIMPPLNGLFGLFADQPGGPTNRLKGGENYHYHLEIEAALSDVYGLRFFNNRLDHVNNYDMGNVFLISPFIQPNIGETIQINVNKVEVSSGEYQYNPSDVNAKIDYWKRIRIGTKELHDKYDILTYESDNLMTVQLTEANITNPGQVVSSGLKVMTELDYQCYINETTMTSSRRDAYHHNDIRGLDAEAKLINNRLNLLVK